MEYVTLGKTGLKISRMGFGSIPIQRIDAAGTKKLLEMMADRGINYIDSARGYTVSESFIGEGIEGMREKFVLATKSMSRTKEAMAKDIEISLHIFAQTILIYIRFTIQIWSSLSRSLDRMAPWKR